MERKSERELVQGQYYATTPTLTDLKKHALLLTHDAALVAMCYGRYLTAPLTLTLGQRRELLLDQSGYLMVDVAAGGAGGGVAQNQVRSVANVWTDVGYAAGNLYMPVDLGQILGAVLSAANPVISGIFDALGNRMPSMDVAARAGFVDLIDRWARQVGQIDLARVLGAAMGHANPVYTRITDGAAWLDPRHVLDGDGATLADVEPTISTATLDSDLNPVVVEGPAFGFDGTSLRPIPLEPASPYEVRVSVNKDNVGLLHSDDSATYITDTVLNYGTTLLSVAPGGTGTRIKYIQFANRMSLVVRVSLRFTSGGADRFTSSLAADGGMINMNLIGCNVVGTTGQWLYANIQSPVAGGTVDITIGYEPY